MHHHAPRLLSAQQAQREHRIVTALELYRTKIDAGTASLSEIHQAGVCSCEVARSTNPLTPDMTEALGLLRIAELGFAEQEDWLGVAAVQCDQALTYFYMGTHIGHLKAVELVKKFVPALEAMHEENPTPAIDHQLGIGYYVRGRLPMRWEDKCNAYLRAHVHLERTSELDGARALRSLLCHWACDAHSIGQRIGGTYFAWRALRSAIKYKDKMHMGRAIAIMIAGKRGELFAQQLRKRR